MQTKRRFGTKNPVLQINEAALIPIARHRRHITRRRQERGDPIKRNRRRPLTLLTASVILLIVGAVLRLSEHDLTPRLQEPFAFSANTAQLAGTLWLPDQPAQAAVVLVHGDGPQNRTSDDGYASLINTLLDAGIAVAAWDKPGVGASTGNWLNQSMQDRTAETRAALETLTSRVDAPVGALGFSQAGWVLPALSAEDAAFLVLIGPAVSWQQQGDYYTRVRLEREGHAASEIAEILAQSAEQDDLMFGAAARYDPAADLTEDRWGFIQRNRTADARADLRRLTLPVLALWGADDLNVDAQSDAAIYRETIQASHPATRVQIVPDATHSLLKSGPYNWQLTLQWPWFTQLRFLLEGRRAYAPGTLDLITRWITDRATEAAQTQP